MGLKNSGKNGNIVVSRKITCPSCGFRIDPDPQTPQCARANPNAAKSGAGNFEEKRRHPRLELRTMVEVNGEKALLFNISTSGLMLSTPFQPPGSEVQITLDNSEQFFTLKGAVRWVGKKRTFSNLVDFGVEILEPPLTFLEFVERMRSFD